jgi:hypothetical protein
MLSKISFPFLSFHSLLKSENLNLGVFDFPLLGTLTPNPFGGFAILNLKLLLFEIQ